MKHRGAVYAIIFFMVTLGVHPIIISTSTVDNYQPDTQFDYSILSEKYCPQILNELSDLMKNDLGAYLTVSSSGGSTATHIQFPLILRTLKPTGVCTVAIIRYTSLDANTTIVDRSGTIIDDVSGPHSLFAHGIGLISFNGSTFNSPMWYVSMSIFPPRINS